MKKKILIIVAVLVILVVVGAAVGGGSDEDTQQVATTTAENTESSEETSKEKTEKTKEENQEESKDEKFSDGVLTLDDYTIKITDYKVIKPGETGNEYGEKPVISFWYDVTNTSDSDDVDPTTAWIMVFKAVQDNDQNKINELEMGSLPDDQFLDSQTEKIKSGGTVSNAEAYELDDLETPVTLKAEDIIGTSYGEQKFEIK